MTPVILITGHWFLSLFCQSFFLHRYCSHQQFKMNFFWERFFYLLTYITQGASFLNPRSYALLHQKHHVFSDTEKDPHSPHNHDSLWSMMLSTYKEYKGYLETPAKNTSKTPSWPTLDVIGKSSYNQVAWVCIYFGVYYSLNLPTYTYLLIPVHFFMGPIQGAIVNWCGHTIGYRNFNTNDKSRNSLPIDFLLMGELYQNNHHRFAKNLNFATQWFEIDFTYQLTKFLSLLGIIKINTSEV